TRLPAPLGLRAATTLTEGLLEHDRSDQSRKAGLARRGLLKCMAWGGTGLVWTVSGGVPGALGLDRALAATPARAFTFVQVSDSHIGFKKPPNPDSRITFREAVAKIGALPVRPDFIIHTGDISQLSRPEEFDDADQIIGEARLPVFHIPGEHDM